MWQLPFILTHVISVLHIEKRAIQKRLKPANQAIRTLHSLMNVSRALLISYSQEDGSRYRQSRRSSFALQPAVREQQVTSLRSGLAIASSNELVISLWRYWNLPRLVLLWPPSQDLLEAIVRVSKSIHFNWQCLHRPSAQRN